MNLQESPRMPNRCPTESDPEGVPTMRSRGGILALTLAAALTGCGKSDEVLVPISGRVTVNGKPATGAAVVFHPVDGANGTHPVAQVEANGEFHLTTIRSGDGAAPGNY